MDLVLAATKDGFSYNLVVKTREAAANPALRSVNFPVTTRNLELRTTQPGRPAYVDRSGRQVLTVGEALMWDSAGASSKAKASVAAAVGEGPSGKAKRSLMQFGGTRAGSSGRSSCSTPGRSPTRRSSRPRCGPRR
ncbi:hypothetical protein [Kribbella solani]|uniref:Uncharacterized protein n=1 Tax=Kribbella solani TaxID=236067 RepID=A0A841DU04_9ACTN|nr:hypothetical protein [Kribbella solani]MBB5980365.1 hypothetical protein [Kribbella solani]